LLAQEEVSAALSRIWERPVRKRDTQGSTGRFPVVSFTTKDFTGRTKGRN
jgi:hypothetical protein